MRSANLRDMLITACAPLIWGTTYSVSTQLLPAGMPLFIGAMRAFPIGVLLLLFVRELPQGSWWWKSLVLGFFNIGLFFALLFVAALRLPGGIAATVGAIQPLLVVFLVWCIERRQPSLATIGLALLGVVGVGALVLSAQARLDPIGVVAAAAGALSMGLGTVLGKRWGQPTKALTMTSWQLLAGGLFLLPLALVVEGLPTQLTTTNMLGFAWLGLLNTALGYLIWFRGVPRLPTTTLPFLGLLSPVMAVLVGYLVLQQTLTWVQLLGALLVLMSVVLVQYLPSSTSVALPKPQPAN